VQARRPARGRPSACPTPAVFAIVDARRMHPLPTLSSVAVGRCCAARGGGVLDHDRRCRYETVGGRRSTSYMGIPAATAGRPAVRARMASAFTVQLRNYRATARARRRARLLRRRRGSRLGGIPSFSTAASETQSSALSAESAATARLRVAIGFLGQLDHAGGLGREVPARHWPQFRQIVVPIAGSVLGHRIEGMLPRPSAVQATCSVSCAQPAQ
jgi:hypothetical protein